MRLQLGDQAAIAVGIAYLVVLAWAMSNISYDVWGAMIVVPVYGVIGVLGMRQMFRGTLAPLAPAMCWGLLVKLGGSLARYWVGFEAYGGGIDAGAYHRFGREEAGLVWAGEQDVLQVIPSGTGTDFVERLTALVYTLTGASQLAGFVTFAFFAYWGLAFFVKAAAVAVPDLAARKYAWVCVLAPSVIYWPSSIGKDAVVMLGLGVGTYGVAQMLSKHRWLSSMLIIGVGLGFVAFIRPHMSGIWVAAAVPALVLALLVGNRSLGTGEVRQAVGRFGLVVVLAVAAIAISFLATFTVRYLEPQGDDSTSTITQIIEETTRRTQQAGSNFTPPSISSPTDWPYAVARTLTRPLPIEARGIAQLVSAAEMAALFGLYAVSWRRVRTLPMMLLTNPYVTFAMTTLFLGGLAYSSFANLGLLARQKSLLVPFLLLPACLPTTVRRTKGTSGAQLERELASTPMVDTQPTSRRGRVPLGRVAETRRASIAPRAGSPASGSNSEANDIWD